MKLPRVQRQDTKSTKAISNVCVLRDVAARTKESLRLHDTKITLIYIILTEASSGTTARIKMMKR